MGNKFEWRGNMLLKNKKQVSIILILSLVMSLFNNFSKEKKSYLLADYDNPRVIEYSQSTSLEGVVDKYIGDVYFEDYSESFAKMKTTNKLPLSSYLGVKYSSTEEDTISVDTEADYIVEENLVKIDLKITDNETNEILEEDEILANVFVDENLNITGSFNYDGIEYDIQELLNLMENEDNIDECALVTIVIASVIGGVIGAVVGGYYSKYQYGSLQWRYVVGGAVIGAAFGGVAGWGVGFIGGIGSASQPAAVSKAINATTLYFSNTVLGHTERPYRASQLLAKEIMRSTTAIKDTAANCYKWVSPGSLNGSKGVWELVVNVETKQCIILYKSQH